MRGNADVLGTYSDYDQLKRMRQAYIVHLLDHVLQERHQVHLNDLAVYREEHPEDAVNLDTVFDIARQMDGEPESSQEEEESDKDLK
jgi:hypothetical protein